MADAEERRLEEDARRDENWKRWGPYLSERQWGTVREDYSPDGDCWNYFSHDHARSRAYRWGEDGLLGITDRQCRLCVGLALWNGKDAILKERLFGLTGPQGCTLKPNFTKRGSTTIEGNHESLGKTVCEFDVHPDKSTPDLLFTENETNSVKMYGVDNYTSFVKDAFHEYIINDEKDAVNPKGRGTKVAAHYVLELAPGEKAVIRLRFYPADAKPKMTFGDGFEQILTLRKTEADEFYNKHIPNICPEEKNIARQALAGLFWSKQFYHYIVKDWMRGDRDQPPPPESRKNGRNADWHHLFNRDVVSMPDKWEYPWYAVWDLGFHMLAIKDIDNEFAKEQLLLFLREWYMHPNGQMPAYEFALGDVNPPVHVLAVIQVWRNSGPRGSRDDLFFKRCFQKLLLNFTWWVNRKDPSGKNLFAGGFLGLDNIGVFDRSRPLPAGFELHQADGTAWMAMFSCAMLNIAIELAITDPSYEDMASKFFEHFVSIVDAINNFGDSGLWNEEDGFYYDHLTANGCTFPMKIRSLVGIVPMFAVLVLEDEKIKKLPGFYKRTRWFLKNRKDLSDQVSFLAKGVGERKDSLMLAIPTKCQLMRTLGYLLDEEEFLSPYGIRSLSKVHEKHPYILNMNGEESRVQYVPGESNTALFGGNSNWRGPIWFPMNYMIVEVLQRYDFYYGETLKVECPTGSGKFMRLKDVALEISRRLCRLFQPDKDGYRPCHGDSELYAKDPNFKDLPLFYEYFHGDTGKGIGASHQTGWTALIVNCLKLSCGSGNGKV
ncbi:uncharacterized protein LOC135499777 isoform X2 [Lineus longissimus]|uniref:uncharacterized protein LOC135499777 isoform X2 n=1 Tax=Lineus longissimus TaxID=88925 RepID=UPI00315CFD70